MKNNEFNLLWTIVIITFSSAMIAFGIRDINRYYARRSISISAQEAQERIYQMHGKLDWDKVADRRRSEINRASETRSRETGSFFRFLSTFVP